MYFYEIWVSSQRYHGDKPLTYSSEESLMPGAIVTVPLGKQTVLGNIFKPVSKPDFATKPIAKVVSTTMIPRQLLKLHAWLMEYYPGPSGLITQLFLPSSLGTSARVKKDTETLTKSSIKLPKLTAEQSAVIDKIQANHGSFLLHGETGSGKTRVYIELAKTTFKKQQSVLVLTPEIGLTPQLVNTFEQTFPDKVVTVHSTQTPAERRDSWLRIHQTNEPLIVIGPRSALFAPLKDIGLIVVDEAHDSAYKQEQMPYYQATRVAARLGYLHDATVVLGSATPLVHDYYTFAAKNLPILRMTQTAKASSESMVEVIDLKDRDQFSRSPWLSNTLIRQIEAALNNNTQSLVFLNRRGTARLVLCQNCGWQAMCPRCDLPLTYHGDHHHLRCHTCGYTTSPPAICPTCSSSDIKFKSVGTKTIVDEVTRLFPKAIIQRFDSDTKKADRLEQHYDDIKEGKVDILVGTQMISKGLDLPRLAVVGVVVADTSLYFPDYTAEERTFQMLHQVMGRVGRGHTKGNIVVQSYYPDSPTIQTAVQKNYDTFYETQLKERELYRFPPYYFVLKIGVERASQSAASKTAQDLAASLLNARLAVELSGPAPAFVEKNAGRYHWQIIVKAKQRSELIKAIKMLPKNCSYDIDPSNLL
jgi:primosomal protein N' (replication factor Y)